MADAPGTDLAVIPAAESAVAHEPVPAPLPPLDTEPRATIPTRTTGSLSRRMILIAAGWILLLLTGGGFALDRVLTTAITQKFLRDGTVIWVEVDGRSGQILGRTSN